MITITTVDTKRWMDEYITMNEKKFLEEKEFVENQIMKAATSGIPFVKVRISSGFGKAMQDEFKGTNFKTTLDYDGDKAELLINWNF